MKITKDNIDEAFNYYVSICKYIEGKDKEVLAIISEYYNAGSKTNGFRINSYQSSFEKDSYKFFCYTSDNSIISGYIPIHILLKATASILKRTVIGSVSKWRKS